MVFFVILHIWKQFFEKFRGDFGYLEMFCQKIGNQMPILLRKMPEFCGKEAFVIEPLGHRNAVRYRSVHLGSITFQRMAERVTEVQDMPQIFVFRVFPDYILLKVNAKINVFLLDFRESVRLAQFPEQFC